jgi:hypothetical protein
MPNDLKKTPEDRSRISITEPDQAQYWADKSEQACPAWHDATRTKNISR